MRRLARRHPFALFTVVAYGWTWPLAVLGERSLLFPLAGLFGPAVAALLVFGLTEGSDGVRRRFRRFSIRREHLWWALVAILLPLILVVPVWTLEMWRGSNLELRLAPISALSVVLAVLIIGEEMGWRGFALPDLLEHRPALVSSLVVGIAWALWHLPNFFLVGFPHHGLPLIAFIIAVVAYSVLFTWLYMRSDGSLTIAVVFHAAINLFSVAGVDPSRQYWWRALVYGLAAMVVVLAGGLRGPTATRTDVRLGDGRVGG